MSSSLSAASVSTAPSVVNTIVVAPGQQKSKRKQTDDELQETAKNLLKAQEKVAEKAYTYANNSQFFSPLDVQDLIRICAENRTKDSDAQRRILRLMSVVPWSMLEFSSLHNVLHEFIQPLLTISKEHLMHLVISKCENVAQFVFADPLPSLETLQADHTHFQTFTITAPKLTCADFSWSTSLNHLVLITPQLRSLTLTGCNLLSRPSLFSPLLQHVEIEGCTTMGHTEFVKTFPLFIGLDMSNYSNQSIYGLMASLNRILSSVGLPFESIPEGLKKNWLHSATAAIEQRQEIERAREYLIGKGNSECQIINLDSIGRFLQPPIIFQFVSKEKPALKTADELVGKILIPSLDPFIHINGLLRLVNEEGEQFTNGASFFQLFTNRIDTEPETFLPLYMRFLKEHSQILDENKDIQTEFKLDLLRTVIAEHLKAHPKNISILLSTYSEGGAASESVMEFVVNLVSGFDPSIVSNLSMSIYFPNEQQRCALALRILRNLQIYPGQDIVTQLTTICHFHYAGTYEAIRTLGVLGAAYPRSAITALSEILADDSKSEEMRTTAAKALLQFDFPIIMESSLYQIFWYIRKHNPEILNAEPARTTRSETYSAGDTTNSSKPPRLALNRQSTSITPTPISGEELLKKEAAIVLIESYLLKYTSEKKGKPRTHGEERNKQIADLRETLQKIKNDPYRGVADMIAAVTSTIKACEQSKGPFRPVSGLAEKLTEALSTIDQL